MTLYFMELSTGEVTPLPISASQITFTIALPAGTYLAYAWTIPNAKIGIPELSGGFTDPRREARLCAYFNLQPIIVMAAQTVTDVDIYNWDAPPGAFPLPPREHTGNGTLVTWGLSSATYGLPDSATCATVSHRPDQDRRRDEPWAVAIRTNSC